MDGKGFTVVQRNGDSDLCRPNRTTNMVRNAYSEIEFYYYVLVYVHTVYIHVDTWTLAIDRDHISYR